MASWTQTSLSRSRAAPRALPTHVCPLAWWRLSCVLQAWLKTWSLVPARLVSYNSVFLRSGTPLWRAGAITPSTPTTPRPTSLAGRLSEKGTLQLLMDVRFVRDVLAGGRPLNPRTASVAVAAAGASGSAAPPLLDPQVRLCLPVCVPHHHMGSYALEYATCCLVCFAAALAATLRVPHACSWHT